MDISSEVNYSTEGLALYVGSRLSVLRRDEHGGYNHTAYFHPDDAFVEALAQFMETYAAEHSGVVNDLVDLEVSHG